MSERYMGGSPAGYGEETDGGMMICPVCGRQIKAGARFCTYCGSSTAGAGAGIGDIPPTDSYREERRECPYCHAPLGEEDVFCVNCGHRLDEGMSQGGYDRGSAPDYPPEEDWGRDDWEDEEERRGLPRAAVVALVIVLVLVIAAGGAAGYVLLRGNPFSSSVQAAAETSADSLEGEVVLDRTGEEETQEQEMEMTEESATAAESAEETAEPESTTAAESAVILETSTREPKVTTAPETTTAVPTTAASGGTAGTTSDKLVYFIEHCDTEYFTSDYFSGFDADMCRYARNGIYARSGRRFDDDTLQAYFNQFSWYSGTISPSAFNDSSLNKYQTQNRDVIVAYEESKGYR